jgi:hypothetical protein
MLGEDCACKIDSTEPCSNWVPSTKTALVWVHDVHPYCINYPGVIAELFFSSREVFEQLLGRPLDDGDALVKVRVPVDFDHWDFIPNDY